MSGRFLPWVSLAIGSSALGFQICVLYPWHIQLENDFLKLERRQEEKLLEFHQLKVGKLDYMDNKLTKILELQKNKSSWVF